MVTLSLNDKELDVIKKSINHCLETCKEGGSRNGCPECAALEGILQRINSL